MSNEANIPPNLPVYDKPREFVKVDNAPESVRVTTPKPHGIINKLMGRMLKSKIKVSSKKTSKAIKKQKKKKIL